MVIKRITVENLKGNSVIFKPELAFTYFVV